MDRIRPIKYQVNWNLVPVQQLLKIMTPLRDGYSAYCNATKVQINPKRIPPEWTELQKFSDTLGFGLNNTISFMHLPKGNIFDWHTDTRLCNINFIKPIKNLAPLEIGDRKYFYDRFVADVCTQRHKVGLGDDRFLMQLSFWENTYDEIVELLEKDGWV